MKKPTTFRDHRVADECQEAWMANCAARGCPRPWSSHVGKDRLCTRHAGRPPKEWPAITEQLLWEDAERARAAAPMQRGLLERYRTPPTPERIAALRAIGAGIVQAHESGESPLRRRWLELRERERRGERLTRYQAEAWRAGLRLPPSAAPEASAWFEHSSDEGPTC